jgi:hypothetical protein
MWQTPRLQAATTCKVRYARLFEPFCNLLHHPMRRLREK